MTRKSVTKPKAKLTDAERFKRFVDMAREVEASPDMKDFEKAFKKVTQPSRPSPAPKASRGSRSKDE
jgi:hypothetical protein